MQFSAAKRYAILHCSALPQSLPCSVRYCRESEGARLTFSAGFRRVLSIASRLLHDNNARTTGLLSRAWGDTTRANVEKAPPKACHRWRAKHREANACPSYALASTHGGRASGTDRYKPELLYCIRLHNDYMNHTGKYDSTRGARTCKRYTQHVQVFVKTYVRRRRGEE